MKSILIVSTFAMILSFGVARTQTREPQDNLLSSFNGTPNSSGLSGGTSIAVNPYTGQALAGFELYRYAKSSSGLSHSIGINYTGGGGIRTDEIASQIGLGWQLNAPLIVTRQVNGRPDDDDELGFMVMPPSIGADPWTGDTARANAISKDFEDGEIDNYSFSTSNSSGNFYIGKNGQIASTIKSNNKILRLLKAGATPVPYYYFEIVDERGVRYIYDVTSSSDIVYGGEAWRNLRAVTTWYISKIIDPYSRDSIVFSYTPKEITYDARFVATNYRRLGASSATFTSSRPLPQTVYDERLTSVYYPNGDSVCFEYDSVKRLDLHSDNALLRIRVKNRYSNSSINLAFRYSYLMSQVGSTIQATVLPYVDYENISSYWNLTIPSNNPFKNPENYFRLRLDGVRRENGSDTVNGFSFGYFSTDHLKTRSSEAIVGRPFGYPSSGSPYADLLTQIVLPTGGVKEIQYEQHTRQSPSPGPLVGRGVRVKCLISKDGMGQNNDNVESFKYVDELGNSSAIFSEDTICSYQYDEVYLPAQTPDRPTHPASYPVDYYPFNLVSNRVDNGSSGGQGYSYWVKQNFSIRQVQTRSGSLVSYSRVEKYLGTPQKYKAKEVYYYSSSAPYYAGPFPFTPLPDLGYADGVLLKMEHFTSANKLMSKTEYYSRVSLKLLDSANFLGIRVVSKQYPSQYNSLYRAFFCPTVAMVIPYRAVQTEYFESNDSMVTATSTDFDTAHLVPRTTTAFDALGNPVVTKYYYPFDFTGIPALETLKSKGIIYYPIRKEATREGAYQNKIVNASATIYDVANGVVSQSESYALAITEPILQTNYPSFNSTSILPSGQPFNRIIQLENYDSKGNLLQSTSGGTTNSTIWNYGKSLVTAKVTAASFDDIDHTSFETEDFGKWTPIGPGSIGYSSDAYTGKRSMVLTPSMGLQSMRLDESKTYIISCWSKQGAPDATVMASSTMTNSLVWTASESHRGWTLYKASIKKCIRVVITPNFSSHIIDELRLLPIGAIMTTQTYDPLFGVTSITDAANHTIHNEYDKFGRQTISRDQDGNILSRKEYKATEAQY